MVNASLIVPPVLVAFAALQHFHYRASEAALVILAGAASMLLTRKVANEGGRSDVYLGAVAYLMIGGVSYFRGGMVGSILVWGVALPTCAALIGRSHGAVLWMVLWLAQFGALSLIEHAGLAPPRIEASPGGVLGGFAGTAAMLVVATMMMGRMREASDKQRTLAIEQLHRANKTEAIGRLAGGVAHDFNNLLAVIAARARVLEKELGPSHHLQEDIRAIEDASERGAALTRRLLDIGREDDVTQPIAFDVNEVVTDVAELLASALTEDARLVVSLSPEPIVIEADPKRMHQVIMNLALNARDAMRGIDGEHELRIRTALVQDDAGRHAVIEVTDNGTGMTEDVIGKIFEPFFTTKPIGDGSGLGLSVVNGIVSRHGGTIDVESASGRGTTMRVRLPASQSAPTTVAPDRRPSIHPTRSWKILLVEDDHAVRKATRRLLKLEGHRVLEAANGEEALDQLAQRGDDVEIIVTDVVMPGMSGPELVRRLRSERPEVEVIFMTGYAGDAIGTDLGSGRAIFLQKPVSRDGFNRALEAAGQLGARDEPGRPPPKNGHGASPAASGR